MTVVKHEPFVWYPRRFSQAHDDKSITYEQFALGAFVCGAADYRTKTLTITIAELRERMHQKRRRSDDSIRRDLHELKEQEWLAFDVDERQRGPWVIRLTGLLVREAQESSAAKNSATAVKVDGDLRQLTAADGLPHNGASAHGERDGGAAELP
jgi:hypothetical protein